MSLSSEIPPLACLWEEPLHGLAVETGSCLLTIDAWHNGTETHDIRTNESRDNAMSQRNIRRISHVLRDVAKGSLTSVMNLRPR
jgi:hypothetical protein